MNSLSTQLITGVLVALTAGLSGCGDAPPPASIPNPNSAITTNGDETTTDKQPVTSTDVERELDEAVNVASKYAGQTKDEYQASMQKKLDELDAKINALQTRTDTASKEVKEDAKREYEEAIATLKQKRQAMSAKFAEIKNASGDAWKDIAAGTDAAWDDLSAAFSSAMSRFEAAEHEAEIRDPGIRKSSG